MAVAASQCVFAGLGPADASVYPDSSPYGHDGAYVGSPLTWQEIDGRHWLSGFSFLDGVDIADASHLDVTTAWTVAAWVHAADYKSQQWGTVVNKGYTTIADMPYTLRFNGATGVPQIGGRIGGLSTTATGSAALTNGQTYHLGGRYTGSALQLFVDGVQVASTACSGSTLVNTLPVNVGRRSGPPNNFYFPGRIADALVLPVALSDSDIAWLADPGNLVPLTSGPMTSGPVLRSPHALNYLDPPQRFRSPHLIGSL